MEWIKRNILFVAGSAVAVILMGLAAYYLIAGSRKNDAALEQLNAEYALLERLNNQNPHPGDDKTDNITAAKQQKKEVDAFIRKATEVFQPVRPIPDSTNLNNAMFAGALRKTIDQLQTEAGRRGVQVPTNFYFSFTAVRDRIMFDKAGLSPLAAQLGDVKAVCDVLIAARVNALDGVRREKVSVHDTEAQQTTDYLLEPSTTNEIAVLAPYEVTFRCFSSELAAVLAGYASSPNGLIVRAMNVEPATLAGATYPGMESPDGFVPSMPQPFVEPAPQPFVPPTAYPGAGAYANPEAGLYGGAPGGALSGNRYADGNRYANPGGGALEGNRYATGNPGYGASPDPYMTPPTPTYPTYPGAANPYVRGRAPTGRGGLPTMLDEKQIKVTMLVQVVKLTSNK